MNRSYLRLVYLRLAGVILLFVALGLAVNAYFSQTTFERALAPDMAKKVAVSAASTRALILEAMENNIAVAEIYGIEQTFDELKASIPDIAYAALTDTSGMVLFQRFTAPVGALEHFKSPAVLALMGGVETPATSVRVGEQYMVSLPVVGPSGAVGVLHVGVSVDFVNRIFTDMLFDVLVVLVVSLFFTLELLHFMAGRRIESALETLGRVIERGAAGDFSTNHKPTRAAMFGGIVQRLEAIRERVNLAYEKLTHTVEAGQRGPTHERATGLKAVRAGMVALARSYRFGTVRRDINEGDDLELSKVRAPLFLFILAEELTRPFLPGYVKHLLVNVSWVSPEVLVSLPIVLFMLIVALGQPFMGLYTERVGSRRVMLVGAAVAAAGFVLSAAAQTVFDLLLWRAIGAVGYGFVFVAAQAHVLEYASPTNRARSFTVFIGAIMVATVCGPSIGGILADNIGGRQTFLVAALLALSSMFVMRGMPNKRESVVGQSQGRLPKWREIGALIVNGRFMTVTGLAAIPAKMLLTGLCFYLVPLYLLHIGSSQSVAGRVLMVYGVVMVVMQPWAAAMASTRQRMEYLVAAGLVISGLGGLMLWFGHTTLWVFAAVFLVALGQSCSIAAQTALVREHCNREVAAIGETAVYGVYRLLERLGNALGPLLASFLVMSVGYRNSFIIAGVTVVSCGCLFFVFTRKVPVRIPRRTAPA
jgi:MFS family permease